MNYKQDWVKCKLGDVGVISTQSINPSKFPDEKFELWSVTNFEFGKPEYLYGKDIGSSKQVVERYDVLLCKINPKINRVWKVEENKNLIQIASTEWIIIRNKDLFSDFIVYYLSESSFRNELLKDVPVLVVLFFYVFFSIKYFYKTI